jgi:ribosomal protein S17
MEPQAPERGRRKFMTGQVVSTAMQKTAVVSIERLVKHATYGKYVRRRNKYKIHDEPIPFFDSIAMRQVGDKNVRTSLTTLILLKITKVGNVDLIFRIHLAS